MTFWEHSGHQWTYITICPPCILGCWGHCRDCLEVTHSLACFSSYMDMWRVLDTFREAGQRETLTGFERHGSYFPWNHFQCGQTLPMQQPSVVATSLLGHHVTWLVTPAWLFVGRNWGIRLEEINWSKTQFAGYWTPERIRCFYIMT